jgi:hypothetical protein
MITKPLILIAIAKEYNKVVSPKPPMHELLASFIEHYEKLIGNLDNYFASLVAEYFAEWLAVKCSENSQKEQTEPIFLQKSEQSTEQSIEQITERDSQRNTEPTGELAFFCSDCTRGFTTQNALNGHKRSCKNV